MRTNKILARGVNKKINSRCDILSLALHELIRKKKIVRQSEELGLIFKLEIWIFLPLSFCNFTRLFERSEFFTFCRDVGIHLKRFFLIPMFFSIPTLFFLHLI